MTTSADVQTAPQPGTFHWPLHTRWILAAFGLALLTGGLLLYWSSRAGQGNQPGSRFRTARAVQGPVQARITATGTLSALVTVQVGSQVSGRIQEIFVDHNSPVHKDQLLARIDPRLFVTALEQARANEAAARANLDRTVAQTYEAGRQEARGRTLLAQGVVGQQEIDVLEATTRSNRAQEAAARAQLTQATAARHQAALNLTFTEIVSPINGVVISRNVDVGQTVAAAFASPTLFLLAEDLAKMQVDTSVAEADVGRLRPGMNASFSVDAYPSKVFTGRVRQVRNAPQTIQNVVTYDAVIDVDNGALELKPGMTANVTFVYAARERALLVPNAALRFRPPADLAAEAQAAATARAGGKRVIFVLEGDTARPVPIQPGVSDGTMTEVLEGAVEPGAAVITDALATAKGGPGSFGRVF